MLDLRTLELTGENTRICLRRCVSNHSAPSLRYRACLLAVSHCSTLDLRKLELTGEIPESIGTLTNLKSIYLYENQLTGSIPYSIGNLLKLESLWLYDNKLTGALPHSIGKLVRVPAVPILHLIQSQSHRQCLQQPMKKRPYLVDGTCFVLRASLCNVLTC